MRIVVRPHAVVLAPPFETVTGGGVAEESAKDLSLEKFAGILGDRQRIHAAESPVIIIPLLQHEGHPADLIFYADELELGITLQDAVEDQFKEGIDDLFKLQIDATAVGFDSGSFVAEHRLLVVAVPGENVQVNRQIQCLRRFPEFIVVLRMKRQVRMRRLPYDRTLD